MTLFAACGRQTLRGFFETLTPEDFFRGVIFLFPCYFPYGKV